LRQDCHEALITEAEIREALSPNLSRLSKQLADVLERTPPELLIFLEQGMLTVVEHKLRGWIFSLQNNSLPVIVSMIHSRQLCVGTGST